MVTPYSQVKKEAMPPYFQKLFTRLDEIQMGTKHSPDTLSQANIVLKKYLSSLDAQGIIFTCELEYLDLGKLLPMNTVEYEQILMLSTQNEMQPGIVEAFYDPITREVNQVIQDGCHRTYVNWFIKGVTDAPMHLIRVGEYGAEVPFDDLPGLKIPVCEITKHSFLNNPKDFKHLEHLVIHK